MFNTTSLGRILGVEVRLHGTLFLLIGALALFSLLGSGVAGAVSTLVILGIALTSVTLHELGHIFAARLFGIGTTGVTLYPFGGVASLTREAKTPTEEVVVALAGPAVNAVLAGLAAIPIALSGAWLEPFATILTVNLVLGIFNLIPAYPMDGGRVLRGGLWPWLGKLLATRYAARAGQVFAALFAGLGLFSGNFMLVVIAAFVFFHASAELARTDYLQRHGQTIPLQQAGWSPFVEQQRPRPPVVPWGADPTPGPFPGGRAAQPPGPRIVLQQVRTPSGRVVRILRPFP